MSTTHWLYTQIVIDSTNQNLYFSAKYSGAYVDYTAAITVGTYNTIADLIAELKTRMEATDTGGVAEYNWTRSGTDGKLTVVASGGGGTPITGFKLRCNTGSTNPIWSVLGFSTTADLTDESAPMTFTSNYQADNCWYMTRGPARDTYDRPRIIGGETIVAASGAAERVTWSDQTVREIDWKVVPATKFLTRFAATNEAFEDIWEDMTHGYYVTYYTYDGASFTSEGKYALLADAESTLEGDRLAPGAAYYNTPVLKLVKQP